MSKLGRNRVFVQRSLQELGQNCIKLMSQAIKTSRDTEKELKTLKTVLGKIPSEAKVQQLQDDVDEITGSLEKPEFIACKTQTAKILTKLMEQIPKQDQAFGKRLDELTDDAKQVEKAAQDISQLISAGVTSGTYKDFTEKVEKMKGSWKIEEIMRKDILAAALQRNKHLKGKNPVNEHSKDPVNLCTGNFIYEKEDLKINGLAPLSFRRFYNALDDWEGSLGEGWIHNYEIRLETEEEFCTFIKEDGAEEIYVRESEQIYRDVQAGLDIISVIEEKDQENKISNKVKKYFYITRKGLQYTFYENGSLLCQKDRNGNTIHFHYNENGRLKKAEADTKEALLYSYQEDGKLSCVKDHTGRCVSMEYWEGKLCRVTNPEGGRLSYTYSRAGKISSVINPRGITSLINSYDKYNRICKQWFPDGGEMKYEYQDDKKQVILTERNGSQITYVHDDRYRSIRNIYEDGEEEFVYNQANQKVLAVDKLGNKTQYGYDGRGNLIRIINALGVKIELQYGEYNQPTHIAVNGEIRVRNQYDEAGNLTETIDALGNCYKISPEKTGRPKTICQPDGSQIELDYDKCGNITQLKDASGSISHYVYDNLNRIVGAKDGNGNAIKYTYDKEGNITQITNANGDTRCYRYNESNRVTEIKDFDGSSVKLEYNALKYPFKVIDQMGRETVFTYDKMWNLTQITEANGAETRVFYNKPNHLEVVWNGIMDLMLDGLKAMNQGIDKIVEDIEEFDISNIDENKVLNANYVSSYKGQLVVKWSPNGRSGSLGSVIILDNQAAAATIQHESGHYAQYQELGLLKYYLGIGYPSIRNGNAQNYYSQPWEVTADMYGGVESSHTPGSESLGERYLQYLKSIKSLGDWIKFLKALPNIVNHDMTIVDGNCS